MAAATAVVTRPLKAYRGYSKLRTRTALGPYGRYMTRSIGRSYGRCVSLISSNPCSRSGLTQPHPPVVSEGARYPGSTPVCLEPFDGDGGGD